MGGLQRKSGAPLGVYVHLPFCVHRCPYCDYPVVEEKPDAGAPYRREILRELETRADRFRGRSLRTLYFGGGTPSAVPVSWISDIADAVRERWPDAEPTVTIEANPEDVDEQRLQAWGSAGVDRLIVGVQSFESSVLERLGRRHAAEEGARALRLASSSPEWTVGADLLFGLSGRGIDSWRSDLERIAEDIPDIEGLYLYEYTEPEGSSSSDVPSAAEETSGRLAAATRLAAGIGLVRTGVASFEAPGAEGGHTRGYWTGWEYLGIGMAASSLRIGDADDGESVGAVRRRNTGSRKEYLDHPEGSASVRRIGAESYFVDRLALAMRSTRGLDWSEIRRQFERAVSNRVVERGREMLRRLVETGRAEREEGRISPTGAGLDVADAIDREMRARLSGIPGS